MTAGHPERTLDEVVEASLPTHGTSVAISGAAAVACAVAEATGEKATLTSILEAAKWGAREGFKRGIWVWSTPLDGRIELAERLVREASDRQSALEAIYRYVGTDMLVAESVAAAFGFSCLSAHRAAAQKRRPTLCRPRTAVVRRASTPSGPACCPRERSPAVSWWAHRRRQPNLIAGC